MNYVRKEEVNDYMSPSLGSCTKYIPPGWVFTPENSYSAPVCTQANTWYVLKIVFSRTACQPHTRQFIFNTFRLLDFLYVAALKKEAILGTVLKTTYMCVKWSLLLACMNMCLCRFPCSGGGILSYSNWKEGIFWGSHCISLHSCAHLFI
jgi:hypothetical protein